MHMYVYCVCTVEYVGLIVNVSVACLIIELLARGVCNGTSL